MNFMFSWQEQYFNHSLHSLVRYCSCHSQHKIHIFSPPCNILYVLHPSHPTLLWGSWLPNYRAQFGMFWVHSHEYLWFAAWLSTSKKNSQRTVALDPKFPHKKRQMLYSIPNSQLKAFTDCFNPCCWIQNKVSELQYCMLSTKILLCWNYMLTLSPPVVTYRFYSV